MTDWQGVSDHYHGLLQHHWPVGPMIDLVDCIMASPDVSRLYPLTSHATLAIGLYERPAWEYWVTQALWIEPGTSADPRPTFRHEGWTTRSSAPFETLERFLSRVGWVQRTTEIANPS